MRIQNTNPSQPSKSSEYNINRQLGPTKESSLEQIKQENNQQINFNQNELSDFIDQLNYQIEALNSNITFAYNDKINSLYIDVKEKSTGRLIRKIPHEEILKLSEHFREIIGMIFDKRG